jgi:hypothetical protein
MRLVGCFEFERLDKPDCQLPIANQKNAYSCVVVHRIARRHRIVQALRMLRKKGGLGIMGGFSDEEWEALLVKLEFSYAGDSAVTNGKMNRLPAVWLNKLPRSKSKKGAVREPEDALRR